MHNVNDTKYAHRQYDNERVKEYIRQLNIIHDNLCDTRYYDCMQIDNIADCTYVLANYPNSGSFGVDLGMVTPDKLTCSSHNGNHDVSLNSNYTVNQKIVAVASHNVTMVGEVQPHHQCSLGQNNPKNSTFMKVPSVCTVMFTNRYWQNTGQGATTYLVFITDGKKFRKFCLWNIFNASGMVQISECTDVEVGYLYIVSTVVIPILLSESFSDRGDPKLTYDNHMKDVWSTQTYGCSYLDYMDQMIDKLILQQDHSETNERDDNCLVMKTDVPTIYSRTVAAVASVAPHIDLDGYDHNHDITDKSKTIGFLNHKQANFTFVGPDRQIQKCNTVEAYIQMARAIHDTGMPNYKFARFPLQSGLNIKAWASYLEDYHDQLLIQYLTYGFPLSIVDYSLTHNTEVSNHHSAIQFPAAIDHYLSKEVSLGAILGPYDSIDYEDLHCSPLLTRPKDGDNRRVILNLSFPAGASLNDAVTRDFFDGRPFTLHFPTIDGILDSIRDIQGTPMLAKIDVARAFRNLRVDPVDAFKFGIKWHNKYYIDVALAFGWVHGSASFQMTSDAILHIMKRHDCKIFAYIDDFIIVSKENDAMCHYEALVELFTELGLPMNQDKLSPPTRTLTCLGVTIDLDKNVLYLEKNKMEEIYRECLLTRSKKSLTRRQFQSLLGKLTYLHKCCKPARIFVNRILSLFRESAGAKRIHLTQEFFMDLDWFITFLPKFSGSSKNFKSNIREMNSLHVDACLTGIGGVWNNRVYAAPVPTYVDFHPNITHLEMLNIVIALRLWAKDWTGSLVTFHCDNLAVVQVVNSGKTRDKFLNACIRHIWLISAVHDIDLHLAHIQGRKNLIADSLSRIYSEKGIPTKSFTALINNYVWEKIPLAFFNMDIAI